MASIVFHSVESTKEALDAQIEQLTRQLSEFKKKWIAHNVDSRRIKNREASFVGNVDGQVT